MPNDESRSRLLKSRQNEANILQSNNQSQKSEVDLHLPNLK